jgi:hypothetical protein
MKKLIATTFLALSLSGCVFQSTTGYELKLVEEHCSTLGGVYMIQTYFFGGVTVRCNDTKTTAVPLDTVEQNLITGR